MTHLNKYKKKNSQLSTATGYVATWKKKEEKKEKTSIKVELVSEMLLRCHGNVKSLRHKSLAHPATKWLCDICQFETLEQTVLQSHSLKPTLLLSVSLFHSV